MQLYFDQIEALSDIGAVLRFARDTCALQGAMRMSYQVAPLYHDQSTLLASVYASGFSPAWMEHYEDEAFRAADPIPARVMRHAGMMTWADAMDAAANTPENLAYFDAMQKHGLVHGFGVPLFGPGARDAYASFDFGRPVKEVPAEKAGTVRSVAQAGHQRICVLLDESASVPALSERELEVLTWAAKGKSVSAIATILDLSPDTVKTYSKRIYLKLDVSDRVGAVVKALRLGLVRM